jgi:Outer membrane protein beta-barrel domain
MYARLSVAAAALSLLAALPADAQLCAGAAPYTTGRMQVGGQLVSNDDYSSYGVGLNFGTARGLYGGPQIANNDYDFVEESGLWIGGSGGYQLRPSRKGFQICPVASLGFGLGPDNIGGSDADMSVRQFSAGAIIGMIAHRDKDFQIIPTGGLSIVNSKVSVEAGGVSDDVTDTFFSLDIGAGVVFNSVWTIKPMLSLPFGDDGRDESISLGVSYNFGRRATVGAQPTRRNR